MKYEGPGDILGFRQHGDLPLRVASLKEHRALLETTHQAAWDLVSSGEFDTTTYQALQSSVASRFPEMLTIPQSG